MWFAEGLDARSSEPKLRERYGRNFLKMLNQMLKRSDVAGESLLAGLCLLLLLNQLC
jgi:hypothetical protein